MSAKFERELNSPIEVFPGRDAEEIGRHYASLHEMRTSKAYETLGEKVEVDYKVSANNDGTSTVTIVEKHS